MPCGSDLAIELSPEKAYRRHGTRDGYALGRVHLDLKSMQGPIMKAATVDCIPPRYGTAKTCTYPAMSIRQGQLSILKRTDTINIETYINSGGWWGHTTCWQLFGAMRVTYWWRPPISSMPCKVIKGTIQYSKELLRSETVDGQ